MPFGTEPMDKGIALALSGGGFRATLFHLGSLWRLNELGYLPKLDRVSSVSGGSITSGVLGLHWNQLNIVNQVASKFNEVVVAPLRNFCSKDIDAPAIGEGALLPWKSVSDAIQEEYNEHLFKKAILQDLPDKPRFVFNTTNFQTGNSFRFSKPYAGDYRLGLLKDPEYSLALAVTASSAFPPFLSPVILSIGVFMEKQQFIISRTCYLILLLTIGFLTNCVTTPRFSETAYEQATSLKVESLQLMGKATETYNLHEKDVNELMTKIDKAYEYANGRPHNERSAQQWAIMKDPNRNLLGGFVRFWKEKGTVDIAFVKGQKNTVAQGFDLIIGLESGKIKDSQSK